ncbi:MAG: hypothetical protein A4E48_00875 [Methanosaeta sp. PtaU1.Bin060]|nr:MAG: hypothetical protein A4E48_00875 [Methanosaeta sp. PtaU1.Bin060]
MNIAIFANTPAQVHFYKNIMLNLEEHGHQVMLLVRNYGETLEVANEFGLEYAIHSNPSSSKAGKIILLPWELLKTYNILRRKFKPDLVSGFGVYDAFTSVLLGSRCIEFTDSEPKINNLAYATQFRLYMPFVDAIITPETFTDDLGRKQIRVNSFKELAYLHPHYFKPDWKIKEMLSLEKDEEYVLLRFNAFDAVHDLGIDGFSAKDKVLLVKEIENYAKVFISSEAGVPDAIKDRVMKIPKSKIHDAIYYAKMLITDTQTMATEAALLGTPAIRRNHFVGPNDMGNFIELEKNYGMIFNYREPDRVINKAIELIQRNNLKKEWNEKRERLLRDKIDITAFMVWIIENYPECVGTLKHNPEISNRFR